MRGEVVEVEEPSFFETLQFSGVLKYKVVVVVALHGDAEVEEAMVERREEKRRKLLT